MATKTEKLRKAYEFKLGKRLTDKLSDAQISLLSSYYNSLSEEEQKQIDNDIAMGKTNDLSDMAKTLIREIEDQEEDIPEGLDNLLGDIRGTEEPPGALAIVPKKPDDLVEEEIDSQILSILGLEDVFDLTYEEYYRELRTAAAAGRMPGSQMSTESMELVTEELKRVKGKTGRFKVKSKKLDINKVLDRKQPSPPGAIVKAQKLIPSVAESAPEVQPREQKPAVDVENLQDDLLNGIGNILESLITIRTVLQSQSKTEQQAVKEDRKETEKKKKKEREAALEKKKPKSPILKALTKPVNDFFGAIKRFFTNVLLGSVVLGLFKWLKDPKNKKAIDDFTNFLENNAGLILGGLLAIASVPLVSTILSLTGAITGIAIPAIKAAFAFLASPAGLLALGTVAGVGAGLSLVKGFADVTRNIITGGSKFREAQDRAASKRQAAGVSRRGKVLERRGSRLVEGNKKRTPEQEKAWQEWLKETKRIDDIRDAMRSEIESEVSKVEPTGQYRNLRGGRRKRTFSAEDRKKQQEIKQRIREKYELKILGTSQPPAVQPQTPLMPGLPPSASQPGAGPTGNQVGSSSASSSLSKAAADLKGMSSAAGPDGGKNGCVWAVNKVFARAGIKTPWGSSNYVPTAEQEMIKSGYQRVSSPSPGDIYVAPGEKHIGIVLDNGNIISNSSSGTKFSWEASPTSYASYYGGPGRYYRIPSSVISTGQPSIDRAVEKEQAQVAQTSPPTPSIPSPTGRGNIVPLPIPTGGGSQQASSGTAPNQAPVPRFSSEDPNNTTTMVVRAIYNIVG